MNNSQPSTESPDQMLFAVDAGAFQRFCDLLDAPPKNNAGLLRLMVLTPLWPKTADIEGADEAK